MDIRLRQVERLHLGLLAAAVCAAYASGWLPAPSLLLGGAVMGANLWLMRQLARRLVAARQRRTTMIALVVAKFALFMGLLMLLFWRAPLDALGFGVGATLLPLACVIAALVPPRAAVPA